MLCVVYRLLCGVCVSLCIECFLLVVAYCLLCDKCLCMLVDWVTFVVNGVCCFMSFVFFLRLRCLCVLIVVC